MSHYKTEMMYDCGNTWSRAAKDRENSEQLEKRFLNCLKKNNSLIISGQVLFHTT